MSTTLLKAGFLIAASIGFILIKSSTKIKQRIFAAPKNCLLKLKGRSKKAAFEPEKVNFC